MLINKDFAARQITITKSYDTAIETLWDAFTNPDILKDWWAPLPYKAITKSMDFVDNGSWHYYMLSPEGEKHWCIVNFYEIEMYKSYQCIDAFCDENGLINTAAPKMKWKNMFTQEQGTSKITNVISFPTEADMRQTLEMGFEQGYEMGLNQLKVLLSN